MFGTLIWRSMRSRLGRNIVIGLTIMISVAFVAGSFVLSDSLKATFDNLFTQLNQEIDLEVRTQTASGDPSLQRDPVPAELVATIADVEGVGYVEGSLSRYAQVVDSKGEPLSSQGGAPTLGVSWSGPGVLSGTVLKEGKAPNGIDQVAMDKLTAKKAGYKVGDTVKIILAGGQQEFTLVGTVGLGDTDGFGGASVSLFDPETAAIVMDAPDQFDAIDIKVTDGADVATVEKAVQQVLPPRTEVVTGQEVADEVASGINEFIGYFGIGLLIFALITAFVSSFIISNVFGITISQRLRELALLRAIGAEARQVRRLVLVEGLILSVISTIVGIFGGIVVAKLLILAFNQSGAGFPDFTPIMSVRTVIVSLIVGIGITMMSVLVPARRASRIPPVAAMQPEAGFSAMHTNRRRALATIMTAGGAVLFLVGLFVRPGGGVGLALGAGLGALLIFLGLSSASSLIARPATRFIGAPVRRFLGVAGALAVDNAGQSPRRTARTASALMIGVALMSAAAVFTSSLSATFNGILDRTLKADYILSTQSQQGLPPKIAEIIADQPDIQAVSPFRFLVGTVDATPVALAAIDPVAFPELINLDLTEGGFEGLQTGDGVLIFTDTAQKLGVGMGDTVEITYENTKKGELTVAGLFADNSFGSDYYVSLDTMTAATTQVQSDQFILARLRDGADPKAAQAEISNALADFPQADLKSNAEFRAQVEGQINQLLSIIAMLLMMSMVIAIIGIALTLALSVFERTREIGLLRAVGTTRRQLRRSIRWEAVIVCLFGALVGVVVGVAIGSALTIAVPDTVIDTFQLPYAVIVMVLVGAVLAGMVAAWYPARKASKMNVLDAVTAQ